MDVEWIKEYIQLAESQNMTEAARILNVSQPTLSKHIAAIEKAVGGALFKRTSTGVQLTRFGASLLPSAYNFIEAEDKFLADAKHLKGGSLESLSISATTHGEIATLYLAKLLAGMEGRYGTEFLEVVTHSPAKSYRQLDTNEVDIVLDFIRPEDIADQPGIDALLLDELPLVASFKKNSPHAKAGGVRIEDLEGLTLIKMEGDYGTACWNCFVEMCEAHGFTPGFKRRYSTELSGLLNASAKLEDKDVLILCKSMAETIFGSFGSFTSVVPILGEDAVLPISAIFKMDNDNPLLDDALNVLASQ